MEKEGTDTSDDGLTFTDIAIRSDQLMTENEKLKTVLGQASNEI